MTTNNTPSFRFPFESQIAHLPPDVQMVHRTTWNSITDINQAIASLKSQVDAKAGTSTSTSSSSVTSTSTASETIINVAGSVTGGTVNNQTGVTSYTIQQSDNASLVLLSDASPIAVILNSALTIPYYTTISNEGIGIVTLTTSTGTVNNVSSITIPGGGFATLFLDGTNWWADSPGIVAGGVTQIIAGTNVTITPTSGVGVVTIDSTGGGGGGTITGVVAGTGLSGGGSSGSVTLNIAATAVTPGSYTNTNLTVNAEGQITAASNGSSSGSYPTVVSSALSTTNYTGSYSWTSPALASGAAYRLSVYITAGTSSSGSVTGTFGFTDGAGTFGGVQIASVVLSSGPSRNFSSDAITFYSGSTSTLTVAFTVTGSIGYTPEAIILERLA